METLPSYLALKHKNWGELFVTCAFGSYDLSIIVIAKKLSQIHRKVARSDWLLWVNYFHTDLCVAMVSMSFCGLGLTTRILRVLAKCG